MTVGLARIGPRKRTGALQLAVAGPRIGKRAQKATLNQRRRPIGRETAAPDDL